MKTAPVNKTIIYALDLNGLWHSVNTAYPAQAKTNCCKQKIKCERFTTNLSDEIKIHKCPELISMENIINGM